MYLSTAFTIKIILNKPEGSLKMHVVFKGNKFMKEQKNIEANVRREYKSRSSSK